MWCAKDFELATVALVSKRTTLVNTNGIFCCHVDYRRFRASCSVNFLSCVEKLYLLILVKTQCRKQNFGVGLSHNTETNAKDVELPCTCQLVNCVVLTCLIYFTSCVQRNVVERRTRVLGSGFGTIMHFAKKCFLTIADILRKVFVPTEMEKDSVELCTTSQSVERATHLRHGQRLELLSQIIVVRPSLPAHDLNTGIVTDESSASFPRLRYMITTSSVRGLASGKEPHIQIHLLRNESVTFSCNPNEFKRLFLVKIINQSTLALSHCVLGS